MSIEIRGSLMRGMLSTITSMLPEEQIRAIEGTSSFFVARSEQDGFVLLTTTNVDGSIYYLLQKNK